MKTEVPKELVDLGERMNDQNNRATQHPMFVVQEDFNRPAAEDEDPDGYWFGEEWHDSAVCCEDCADMIEKAEEEGDYPESDELCDDCKRDNGRPYVTEKRFNLRCGIFFTAEACDAHIKSNHYHYTNARSYGVSAWRNYELQSVQKFLSALPTGEVKNFYQ